MANEQQRAAIYLSLHRGENYPALDAQLDETLRRSREHGHARVAVYGDVSGSLNAARRRQVTRVLERMRADELPGSVSFDTDTPDDLVFLGQQAQAHGFALAVERRHITVTTPWGDRPPG